MTHASQPDSPIGTHEPEALAFTPVPLARYRHDGWTAERQHLFIAMLTQTGVVALAARACGMSAAAAYALRKRAGAESWAAAWDAALVEGRHRAFDRAMERGIEGVRTPLYRNGLYVGTRHRFDDRALFAALRHIDRPVPRRPIPGGPAQT